MSMRHEGYVEGNIEKLWDKWRLDTVAIWGIMVWVKLFYKQFVMK